MTQATCAMCAIHGAAEALPGDFREWTRHVHDALKGAQAPRPRVAVIDGMDPLSIAGHWVPEQVKRAGGIAVLGGPGAHSQAVTMGALRAADPEVLIIAPWGTGLDAAEDAARSCLESPEWGWVRGRRVFVIATDILRARAESDLIAAIETLAALFNPACFAVDWSTRAVRVALSSERLVKGIP